MATAAALIVAAAFLAFVGAAAYLGKLPLAVLAVYLAASLIAFFAYALDKSAARKGEWRTQEGTLHLFGVIGGWPGALAAQRLLRHKTRKRSFQVVFWMMVFINCAALGWLLSPDGEAMVRLVIKTWHV